MTWGLQTSNLEHFGYTGLQQNGPILLPSLFPIRTTTFLLNQGCFPWDGHSTKSNRLII